MPREIVFIDEDLCDGCGLCVPSCEEGALRIVNGKARLVEDRLCDGMGACIGYCPRGAIRIERREADAFHEVAVAKHLRQGAATFDASSTTIPLHQSPLGVPGEAKFAGGCPGSRLASFGKRNRTTPRAGTAEPKGTQPSELTHWPVQLRLVPAHAPFLVGAKLLVAADCVPVAYGAFHSELLAERVVLIGCPKFDDLEAYVDKLAAIIQRNELQEIMVTRMEVPCCRGILMAVLEARQRAGVSVEVVDVMIGTGGERLTRRIATEAVV